MESKTYYDLLDVSFEATAREIKKGYFKKVRQNPPDKAPEKFKKIRAAYEILSDPLAKKEYDARVNLPKWLTSGLESAQNFRRKGKAARAIKIYEEILKKHKRIKFIEVELGEAYIENHNTQKAIDLFKSILEKDKDDLVILKRLVHAYAARGWFKKAIEVCDYMIAQELEAIEKIYSMKLSVYAIKGKGKEAQKIALLLLPFDEVDKITLYGTILATEMDHVEDSSQITYESYEKTREYCILFSDYLKENPELIKDILEFIVSITLIAFPSDEAFELSDALVEHINDETMIEEYNEAKANKRLKEEMSKIEKDGRIPGPLVDLMHLSFFKTEYEMNGSYDSDIIDMKIEIIDQYDYYRSKIGIVKHEYVILYSAIEDFVKEIKSEKSRIKLAKKFYKILKDDEAYASDSYGEDELFHEETYISAVVKVKRNDPCPCGSGKKYKKCCINK